MARTKQTAPPGTVRYHLQPFTDHAGQSAIRVRNSCAHEPIPTNFHAQPLFVFQIYLTIPLELDERSAECLRTATSLSELERTVLTDLVDYVSAHVASGTRRPEPIWEFYTAQEGIFECVEHQRREIAYRKAMRENPSVPPIPKVVPSPDYSDERTGFIIIIDSDNFKLCFSYPHGQYGQGPLWVFMDRRFPPRISWEPQLRLDRNPDTEALGNLGPQASQMILPERVDTSFLRIQRPVEMCVGLKRLFASSYAHPYPPVLLQGRMDVAWDEDEGGPDAECTIETEDAISMLQGIAARLSLSTFNISKPNATDIIISNIAGVSEPDLRYIIYVPFLYLPRMDDKLEQAAIAFTYEITSRFSGRKTFLFEFCKPPSKSLSTILKAQRERNVPDNYIGAFTTFSNVENNKSNEECSPRVRAYPTARTEHADEHDPAKSDKEPYRTFIVVLERPDFSQAKGAVLFLETDGGKPKPSVVQEMSSQYSHAEFQDYWEMQLWRCAGMEEVAMRLQMV